MSALQGWPSAPSEQPPAEPAQIQADQWLQEKRQQKPWNERVWEIVFPIWAVPVQSYYVTNKGIEGPKPKGADKCVHHDIHTDRNVGWKHVWWLLKFHDVAFCIYRRCCVSELCTLMFPFWVWKYFAGSIFFTILKYWFSWCIGNRFFFVVFAMHVEWFTPYHFSMICNCSTAYLLYFP